ncbi:FMN-binding negative transcriptional regulator [Gluconacetobacter sacchari]|uniref:FMN-binding negative transcriptional regulator n=2 Tax=Gluconacetobacter sacchari TaxID=92759 RepID=A0A7W4ID97_9PROT|nr:FMN-binding negative transcriptional regulator [Gluconacetobacter sacchari]MBB2160750.1 FMN-binding negative transcriptional regulator [Gluconacetobacter sacchari]
MYAPPDYACDDSARLHDLMARVRLATVVTLPGGAGSRPPVACHLPLLLDRDRGPLGTLVGHLDRRNPQLADLAAGRPVLVTFLGADAGVSPDWYRTSPRVPTWLYTAAHATGTPAVIEDPAALRTILDRSSALAMPDGGAWRPGAVGGYIDRLLGAIAGFEIPIATLRGQIRLGQHNGAEDWQGVHDALSHGTLQQRRVAEDMAAFGRAPGG